MAFNPVSSRNSPPETWVAVTPSDTEVLRGFQWLIVTVDGNLELRGPNDSASVTLAVTAGQYIPFGAGYVRAASTASVVAAG